MDIKKFTRETCKLLSDKFNVHRLLNDLPSRDINGSDKLFIFSHCGPGRYEKIYLLIAHAMSKRGYPCVFLFKEDPLHEFSPRLIYVCVNEMILFISICYSFYCTSES